MINKTKTIAALSIALALAANAGGVVAESKGKNEDDHGHGVAACKQVATALATDPSGIHAALKTALGSAVTDEASGLDLNMWATVVNRDGVVCAVAFSGANRKSQASRC